MQISCPNCTKKFEIDDKLIPSEGRLLQCGSCNNKWFYKHKLQELSKQESKPIPKIKKNINDTKVQKSEKLIKPKDEKETIVIPDIKDDPVKEKNNKIIKKINYFKIFLVSIITIITLILILDTFKNQINVIFPNIDIFLYNLYETLIDLSLFFKDLIQ